MTAAMPDDEGNEDDLSGSSIEPYIRPSSGGRPEGDDPRRCTSMKSDRSGRCGRWAIEGHTVCPMHGGSVPNVKRTAQLKLLDLVPVATRKHKEVLENATDERVILKAVEMVYDRTGLEPKSSQRDTVVVRELLVSRLLGRRGETPMGPMPSEEDEIHEAEIVEDDEEGLTAEDLI